MTIVDNSDWGKETKRINAGREISRGMVVRDRYGNPGVVVMVNKPENPTTEDHGMVAVWQSERTNHGDDNCEHYVYLGWEYWLRIED